MLKEDRIPAQQTDFSWKGLENPKRDKESVVYNGPLKEVFNWPAKLQTS